MDKNKEIKEKIRELAKIRKKIKLNKKLAFHYSLENPQDFDGNPFRDEIASLQLEEIHCLQELQQLQRDLHQTLHQTLNSSFFRVK